ncbi:MAG TPA: hypothetical protein PKC89_07385, partial [Pyrinomonadaceae bacterium]|nr:hypothetical protein [Pyrinomonadaceae bacterium]
PPPEKPGTLIGRASPTALLRGKPVKQVASSFAFFASPLRSLRLRSWFEKAKAAILKGESRMENVV